MKQPHILCDKKDVAENILLPGDPARVLRAAEYLDSWSEIAFNREFRTLTGSYKGMPVTICSTGIGGPSMVIALEELIACGAKNFIRIGSAGASRSGIALGDLIIPTATVREDGASRMYAEEGYPAAPDYYLLSALIETCRKQSLQFHVGITRSHDSFYIDDEAERMKKANSMNVLGSDMETATLFTLASLRGVRAAAVLNNVVLYERDVKEGIGDYVDQSSLTARGEELEIQVALEALKEVLF
ncbi:MULTISPECIES: nucleoside phosphorylase [unclassified Oceanispirochaeta]|uniref:nucleoside phosphorylase n=1 Tax=unclassified Oceanispirochaeta TaxID=2635722 RepID=UPI000E095F1F|nr:MULTISPECIES: nucleoside phosphorylase [unclassified Oceanispirochaeta]MBF9016758.1 nucleoside phosphorylase [Oceanispirochaeta sp. M2]NPD72028.1 nucleoside phosphorylase [Oceanispirochaeta sp. M1]RDG32472.1 nucleoside phosphorylase [Oceanispirochaeta sp. M1]